MTWLSDLENRQKAEAEVKQKKEQAENLKTEQERLREQRLHAVYEKQYKKQVDSICECVNQLVSRAKAAGVVDLSGWGGVYAIKDAFGTVSLRIATIERSHWSSRIEAFLEENGRIKVSYSWHDPADKRSREMTLPIQSVTASVIEGWLEWVVSEKTEAFIDRLWRRLRDG